MYQPKGAIGIVVAWQKLFHTECHEGANIEEHIRTLTQYWKNLNALGSSITKDEFSITILASLPDSWDSFIQGIDTSSLSDSTKLISCILEQARWKVIKPSSDDIALASIKHQPHCFWCKKKGHFIWDCPYPPDSGSESDSDSNSKTGKSKSHHAHATVDFGTNYAFWIQFVISSFSLQLCMCCIQIFGSNKFCHVFPFICIRMCSGWPCLYSCTADVSSTLRICSHSL